ncbi:MAG: hypothetical protein IJ819_00080 [Clostridiales bacterium]|nr:hypothetical protein [Clostridiales bacterium]
MSVDISKYLFHLGNIDIQPKVSGLKWSIMSIQSADSGRAEDGTMIATLVARKRKLEVSYANLTPTQAKAILSVVCGDMFFNVTYYDFLSGEQETRTFYVGDRSGNWYNFNIERGIENLQFNLIEQ